MSISAWRFLALFGPFLLITSAAAGDGVLEINQVCALNAGGCTSGDLAGFPVTLSAPGSYRLTGNLSVTSAADVGIDVLAEGVTIDLAGFEIRGPELCAGAPLSCSPADSGDGIRALSSSVQVRNGVVRGMGRNGLSLGDDCAVENVTVLLNAGLGIDAGQGCEVRGNRSVRNGTIGVRLGDDGLATGNVVNGNLGVGMVLGGLTGFMGNVLTENNGGNLQPQLSGGAALGTNVCGAGGPSCVSCPMGFVDCGGFCTDPTTDEDNCGACANPCLAGDFCSSGSCVAGTGCPAGQTDCGAYCADLLTDEQHCGVCGFTCTSGESCIGASCTLVCAGGTVQCGGACVALNWDPNNCGGCGNACAGGQACVFGSCS